MQDLALARSRSKVRVPASFAGPTPRRYEVQDLLGRGGMGDVLALSDHHLGRVVAMKLLRQENAAEPHLVQRFVREARVQAQLEHPSVVPVYDLGAGDDLPCFTMKRVRGQTLATILRRLLQREESTRRTYSLRKLLNAFSQLCLALDYVHERGVVHRDVKPSNVMLGDYGEVYLLDWGVAKVTSHADEPTPIPGPTPDELDLTDPGDVFGTPGFASPEQIRGEPVDRRSDVFSLGAILFELLTLHPLLGGEHPAARINATLAGVDTRAAAAATGVEVQSGLLDICVHATAHDPAARYATARSLHDDIEHFLDELIELERRRAAAHTHAERAALAADRTLTDSAEHERPNALREVGRALALDPESKSALTTLIRLLADPPRALPDEVRRGLERSAHETAGRTRAGTIGALACVLVLSPLILAMGVRSWPLFAFLVALNVASIVAGLISARVRVYGVGTDLVFGAAMFWASGLSMMFGPFLMVPAIAGIVTTAYLLIRRRHPVFPVVVLGWLAFLVPWALQATGVLPASYTFVNGDLVMHPMMHALPPVPTTLFLLAASLAIVALPALILSRLRRALIDAEEKARLQAWQLAQLVPPAAELEEP